MKLLKYPKRMLTIIKNKRYRRIKYQEFLLFQYPVLFCKIHINRVFLNVLKQKNSMLKIVF